MSDANSNPQSPADESISGPTPRERRARVFKKGKMVFQHGLRSIPCIVRNLSDNGALLEFEQAYMLPREFDLHIDLENYEVTCERRWEEGLRCGVQFISEKRYVTAQRAQVLRSSEDALNGGPDERRDSPDNFFQRRQLKDGEDDRRASPRRVRTVDASGRPTFGKRR